LGSIAQLQSGEKSSGQQSMAAERYSAPMKLSATLCTFQSALLELANGSQNWVRCIRGPGYVVIVREKVGSDREGSFLLWNNSVMGPNFEYWDSYSFGTPVNCGDIAASIGRFG